MILILLQNAWSRWYKRIGKPGEPPTRLKERVWDRKDWLDATWSSASGRRLKRMLVDIPEEEYWIDDTTLHIAEKASGIVAPDLKHVWDVIEKQKIDFIVACGRQSQGVINTLEYVKVKKWPGIFMPHPAARLLHNEALDMANLVIRDRRLLSGQICQDRWEIDTWGKLEVREDKIPA